MYIAERMAAPAVLGYVFSMLNAARDGRSITLLIDAVIAIVIAAVTLIGTIKLGSGDAKPLDVLGASLLVASAASLVARRSWPIPTLLATALLAVTYDALDYPLALWTIPLVVALFSAVAAGRRAASLAITVLPFGALVLTDILFKRGHFTEPSSALWFTGWLTVGFVAGEVSRARRAYLNEVERRAADAERTRDEEARRRASEERMRIAREVHDVVAHSISVINVQAGVALHLLERHPEQARPALEAITQTSKDALRDLRATLGILRGPDDAESRAPAPTLARLDDLVAGAETAGVSMEVRVTGDERPLPPRVDLAAYRIAQESLTNVARHARPARATLSIAYGPRELVVEVHDDGRTAPDTRALRDGHGLIGMRERAASVGGELEAGPRPEGGFRVRARLPLNGQA